MNPYIIVLNTVIAVVVTIGINHISRILRRLLNKVEYVHIEVQAMDFALEKSIGNGYSKDRETKRSELIKKSSFINDKEYHA